MKAIISVQNLSKQYRIGTRRASYATLKETLAGALRSPFKRVMSRNGDSSDERIWALKDISFEVMPGEVVGIIGRNGAGKSTLLKILSCITEPTAGRVELYGRIASLLEVGTGFHPELTGRENIFLNGAILGMRRNEIQRKFDEIVAFSEIERFIDTPVKWYSSGMYVRLAFSVAAHIEPEILIMDEVLAVGDAAFQFKCLNKMDEIREQGHTILFVSHNMQAITRLCQRGIYLADGGIVKDGPAPLVASAYLTSRLKTSGAHTWNVPGEAPGDGVARLRAMRVRDAGGETVQTVDIRQPVGIEMEYEVLKPGHQLVPNFHFYNEEGLCLFVAHDLDPLWYHRPRPVGTYRSTAWVPGNYLAEGTMLIGAALSTYDPVAVHFYEPEAVVFQVVDSLAGDSARGDFTGTMPGVVRPILRWETEVAALAHGGRAP